MLNSSLRAHPQDAEPRLRSRECPPAFFSPLLCLANPEIYAAVWRIPSMLLRSSTHSHLGRERLALSPVPCTQRCRSSSKYGKGHLRPSLVASAPGQVRNGPPCSTDCLPLRSGVSSLPITCTHSGKIHCLLPGRASHPHRRPRAQRNRSERLLFQSHAEPLGLASGQARDSPVNG